MEGISPSILDTLRQLGLTEYGARCYVALLSLKSGEAAAIAEAAQVPRTKVYGALKDLADSGWVIATGGRPLVYKPVPPEERIHTAEKRITEQAATATRELQARFTMGTQMMPVSLYLIHGRPAIEAKSLELISRARDELLVNLGFALAGEERALAEALRQAQRRGVTIRLLVGPGVDASHLASLADDARRAIFPFRAIICDWRQALLTLPQADGEPVALWNPTQSFMQALAPTLMGAWESAPQLDRR